MRYDPIAAATEGWGDDGSQPVRYDSVDHEEGGAAENQEAGQELVAETQEEDEEEESQLVKEEEEEDAQAEASAEAIEEEAPQVAAALENEEGQVIVGEPKINASGQQWWMH